MKQRIWSTVWLVAALTRGEFQHLRIADSLQACFSSAHKIDCRFAKACSGNDRMTQVSIREEADAHDFLSPIAWRARSSFAQSSGLASLKGMADASNSRSFSSRYGSTVAWWSR